MTLDPVVSGGETVIAIQQAIEKAAEAIVLREVATSTSLAYMMSGGVLPNHSELKCDEVKCGK